MDSEFFTFCKLILINFLIMLVLKSQISMWTRNAEIFHSAFIFTLYQAEKSERYHPTTKISKEK